MADLVHSYSNAFLGTQIVTSQAFNQICHYNFL